MHRILPAVLLILCLLNVSAQTPASTKTPTPIKVESFPVVPILRPSLTDRASSSLVAEMMPYVAPLVFETSEITSTLVLANASTEATTATVTLFSVDGTKSDRRKFTLSPHEKKEIPISTPKGGSDPNERWGSVTVEQDSQSTGVVVAGQVLVTDRRASIPAYIDEELAMPEMEGSTSLSAVTDESEGPPMVGITNISSVVQNISIACVRNEKTPVVSQVAIAAYATSTVQACSSTSRSTLAAYLSSIEQNSSPGVFGIKLVGDGAPGSYSAFALAPHRRGREVVFSSVPFYDPNMIHSSDVVFAGVPIGPQETLPDGVYIPRLSLANFSESPLKFSILLADTVTSPVKDADGNSRPPSANVLHTGTIPPYQTIDYAFSGQEAQSGLLHSVVVSTDAKPGTYQAKLVSRSTGILYQVELLAKETREMNNAGIHPWTVRGDNQSHVVLFNHSKNDAKVGVFISSGAATVWEKEMMLAPSETREVSINQLQSEQIPDDQGRRIPKSLKEGVVDWRTPDSGQLTGRLMVTSHADAMARNFSCGTYYGVCSFYFETFSSFVQAGGDGQLYEALADYCNFNPNAIQKCGPGTPTTGLVNYNWSVGATNIIGLKQASQQYVKMPTLHGVSAGTGYANVQVTAGQCSSGGGGNPTTQVPTSLKLVKAPPTILQTGSGAQHGCPSGWYGIEIDVDYQVLDQKGTPIASANMEPQESVPGLTTGYQDIGAPNTTYPQEAKFTRADGTFDDVPVGNCPPVPVTTLTPFPHPTQSIQILMNGTAYPVRTNNWSYSTTNLPNHGTITNGVDINATQ
jgi:hypothetical protein